MNDHDHVVLVLDDEQPVRVGLQRLLSAHGFRVKLHARPEEIYASGMPAVPCCLLLDHQLADGITGLQVHAEIHRRGWSIPTVFLTAHWSVQSVVSAMRAGADDFLTKPYNPDDLLKAVARALAHSAANNRANLASSDLQSRAASLTPREREIVCLIVSGLLNKQIADELKLALVTVKVHRGRAMRKLGARTSAELAHIASLAGIKPHF